MSEERDDLIKRLGVVSEAAYIGLLVEERALFKEAASEIQRLRGEVERLRAANKIWVPTTEHQPSIVFCVPSPTPSNREPG